MTPDQTQPGNGDTMFIFHGVQEWGMIICCQKDDESRAPVGAVSTEWEAHGNHG